MNVCLQCGTDALVEEGGSSAGPSIRRRHWTCRRCGWVNSQTAKTWEQFVQDFAAEPEEDRHGG